MPIWGPIGENKALDGEGENTRIYSISRCYMERAGGVCTNHKLWERVVVYLRAEHSKLHPAEEEIHVRLGTCGSYYSWPALIAGDPETLSEICHRTSHLNDKYCRSVVADFQKTHPVKSYLIWIREKVIYWNMLIFAFYAEVKWGPRKFWNMALKYISIFGRCTGA